MNYRFLPLSLLIGFILLFTACGSLPHQSVPTLSVTLLPSSTSIPIVTPSTATETLIPSRTPAIDFPLAGRWTGIAQNGDFKMQVNVTLESACQVGQVCGTIDLVTIPCFATFTLLGEQGGIYEFRAENKKGSCGEGRDFLQLQPDGTLQYISRGDEYGETRGTLSRIQSIPILFDDDGSPDGTTALLYLLSHPAVDLKSVSITYGEAHPAIYIQHMGRMLEDFGFTDIPLGAGQDSPLAGSNSFPEWVRQSSNNFWGFPIPNAGKTYPVQDSADLIVSVIQASPKPVTLFFSGPFTNLARALRRQPEIVTSIRALYYMGGAVYAPGNVHDFYPDSDNVYADWNIYSDPIAAQQVFEYGLPIYLVPLDATNQVVITKEDTSQWRAGGRISDFAADMYDMLMDTSGKKDFYIWDLMTAVVMLKPELCTFEPLHLEVITAEGNKSGQMIVTDGAPNVQVCLQPQADGIRRTLIEVFSASNPLSK
jgi:purine nucleosidase/pyrimidine-specific ribonucleoside hydrolase